MEEAATGTLLLGTTVTRVLTERDGRVTALEARALGAEPVRLQARHYVLACGGLETPRLLLLSRGAGARLAPAAPELVGRGFMEHLILTGRATLPGSWDPASPELRSAVTYGYVPQARALGLGDILVKFFQNASPAGPPTSSQLTVLVELEMEPRDANRVELDPSSSDAFGDPGALVSLSPSSKDRETIAHGRRLLHDVLLGAGGQELALDNRVSWACHHMGTCLLGTDPAQSVVDPQLRLHGSENLWLAGSAPFPSAGAASPTLTIAALSLRLADRLVATLRS
jgi:choline dehydrogenase-like flavoprotein